MSRQIYVNLPVRSLPAALQFFRSLGFEFKPEFTNDAAACMIVGEESYVMLLTEEFFRGFAPHPICDATTHTEVLVCLSCASRDEVDRLVRQAVAAGGRTHQEPQEHGGSMYGHGFLDLDGHCWELIHQPVRTAGGGA